MVLAGWSKPGKVRVHRLGDGELLKEHDSGVGMRKGYLLSAPVLDSSGQLYIVNGDGSRDKPASSGGLRIVDPITGESEREDPHWVRSPTAAILHVERGLVVYHDGGDGGRGDRSNLHLIRPDGAPTTTFSVLDLMPAIHTILDGSRLFVLTYQPGRSMTSGARLFRIDLGRHTYVSYQHPAPALAYSAPVLTQRYLVLSMVEPNRAEITCYDRDADKEGAPPQPVFRGDGAREEARFRLLSRDTDRFHIAAGVGLSGTGLVWSTPFKTVKLRAPGEGR